MNYAAETAWEDRQLANHYADQEAAEAHDDAINEVVDGLITDPDEIDECDNMGDVLTCVARIIKMRCDEDKDNLFAELSKLEDAVRAGLSKRAENVLQRRMDSDAEYAALSRAGL